MRRQLRGDDLGEGIECIAGVTGVLVVEDRDRTVEQLAAALERLDGVDEGRRLDAADDGVHLVEVFGHAGLDGREVVLDADIGERRKFVRQGAAGGEGILDIKGNVRHRASIASQPPTAPLVTHQRRRWVTKGAVAVSQPIHRNVLWGNGFSGAHCQTPCLVWAA